MLTSSTDNQEKVLIQGFRFKITNKVKISSTLSGYVLTEQDFIPKILHSSSWMAKSYHRETVLIFEDLLNRDMICKCSANAEL